MMIQILRLCLWPLGVLDMIKVFLFLWASALYAQTPQDVRHFLAFSNSHKVLEKDISKVIDRPYGVWKELIHFYHPEKKESKLCLVYRVPYKNKVKGELSFIETKGDCIANRDRGWTLEDIQNLKLDIKSNEIKMSYDKGELVFKLYNRSSSYSWGYHPKSKSSFKKEAPFWDSQSWRCKKVNDKCEVVGQDNCHLCPTSTYTVLRSKCTTDQDRYCGKDLCGLKNYPACIRHLFAGNEFFRTGCFQKTDIGLCSRGLVTICDKDKNVICY